MAGKAVTPRDLVLTVWDVVSIFVANLCFASVHNHAERAPVIEAKEIHCECTLVDNGM